MKRFLQVFLIVAFVFLLAACNGKEADLKLGHAFYATEDDGGIKVVAVVLDGEEIIDVFLDELYFFNEDDNAKELTGGNGRLSNGYAEGKVLGSKRINTKIYTKSMEVAGSKQQISESYDAIEKYCIGKTVADLEDVINDGEWDVISGSTLTGNLGYLQAIVEAAKAAE